MVRPGSERPTGRRSARTRAALTGNSVSKPGRWARKRDAAEGSRREHKRRERGRNPTRPWDFAARGPPRASAKSPRVERRTSVNRSPCGRRTSLGLAPGMSTPPCRQYTRIGGRFHEIPSFTIPGETLLPACSSTSNQNGADTEVAFYVTIFHPDSRNFALGIAQPAPWIGWL